MSEIPDELKYCSSHEWVSSVEDGVVTVGITDHAQDQLGDLVFIELPEIGAALDTKVECAVVESVKAASDIYSPVSGEVTEVNEALVDSPELVNDDAYGDGWLFKIRITDEAELEELLDAAGYQEIVDA